ncbi:MAG: hypothetical protein ACI4CY_01290 [Candidatus Gastranaerophilaceae bacterium]
MAKKLTITEILERKKAIEPLADSYFSEYLGTEIEIKKTKPKRIFDIIETQKDDYYKCYLKLIYECCPLFQAQELVEEYHPVEPFDVVEKLLDGNMKEIFELGNLIMKKYGLVPRDGVKNLKNE